MSFLALRFISAFCNFNPITFLPVCFPQGRPDIGDHVSVLLLNTAEAGAELGAKVSTACLLPGFRQRGGFAEGFHGSEHHPPPFMRSLCKPAPFLPAPQPPLQSPVTPRNPTGQQHPMTPCPHFSLASATATGASVLFTVFLPLSRLQSK